jgi:toxin ParE1/3/4
MKYKVSLTDDALHDLEDIYDYIAGSDLPENADYVLDKIEEAVLSLTELPERGTCPEELSELGLNEYREIHFKPYRVIYRVMAKHVYVYFITDGRRDMQTLLARRLLGVF